MRQPTIHVNPDLKIQIGRASLTLTPVAGLLFAEKLVRASLRKALIDEAESLAEEVHAANLAKAKSRRGPRQ